MARCGEASQSTRCVLPPGSRYAFATQARAKFDSYDTDHNGALDSQEVRSAICYAIFYAMYYAIFDAIF
eukprot:3377497-Rhodomonas_salina.3